MLKMPMKYGGERMGLVINGGPQHPRYATDRPALYCWRSLGYGIVHITVTRYLATLIVGHGNALPESIRDPESVGDSYDGQR